MLDRQQIINTLERLKNSELRPSSHLYPDHGAIKIWDAVNVWRGDKESPNSNPAIIFLRVVLAANRNYTKQVKPKIDKIISEYPNLKSFAELEILVNELSQKEFFDFWGHKDHKKYQTLKDLLKAVHKIRDRYKIEDDYNLMQQWSKDLNLAKYDKDVIGKIKNVAIATIQHLRMDFGIDTVKPDQRVIEVLQREFQFMKVSQKRAIQIVEEIAKISEIQIRKIDLILVNYGSGYYADRNYLNEKLLRREIANKLLKLGVKIKIIKQATGVKMKSE